MKFYELSTFQLCCGPDLVESAPYSWIAPATLAESIPHAWVAQGARRTPHRQMWVQLSPLSWRLLDAPLTAIAKRYWSMLHEIQ